MRKGKEMSRRKSKLKASTPVVKTFTKSYTADAILVYSPEKELEVLTSLASCAQPKIDWKPAIILAATYLEKFGVERLKRHFETKEIKLGEKLERLNLPQVATLLYGLELMNNKNFTHVDQIWRERTKIVHSKKPLPAYVGEKANKKYGKMVRDALEIIQFLKSKKEK